jgi:hypothetical protein
LNEAAAVTDGADFVDERDVGQTDEEEVSGYVLERRWTSVSSFTKQIWYFLSIFSAYCSLFGFFLSLFRWAWSRSIYPAQASYRLKSRTWTQNPFFTVRPAASTAWAYTWPPKARMALPGEYAGCADRKVHSPSSGAVSTGESAKRAVKEVYALAFLREKGWVLGSAGDVSATTVEGGEGSGGDIVDADYLEFIAIWGFETESIKPHKHPGRIRLFQIKFMRCE